MSYLLFMSCYLPLILIEFEELNLIDKRRKSRNVAGAVRTECQLVGKVEAIDAAGVHQLESLNKAGEHGFTNDMDDGVTLSVSLVIGFAGEHKEAAIVKADTLGVGSLGAFALTHHLIVESFGVTFYLWVFLHEFGEILFLRGIHRLLGFGGRLAGADGVHGHDVVEGIHNLLRRHGLFLASGKSIAGRLKDKVGVELLKEACLEGVGNILAISPGEAVDSGLEFRSLGERFLVAVVRTGNESKSTGKEKDCLFHESILFNDKFLGKNAIVNRDTDEIDTAFKG